MADDQIIRELPLIQRRAKHNEDQDWNFRTRLKVGINLSNDELDSVVQEITDNVWSQIDCTTCANCCKTLQIVIDDKDIRRLARKFGITTRAFAEKHVMVAEDGVKSFQTMPCPFLGDDNKCTVYEDRPRACRDFPYLHEPGFRHRTISAIENTSTCPIVFNVWDRLKRRFSRR